MQCKVAPCEDNTTGTQNYCEYHYNRWRTSFKKNGLSIERFEDMMSVQQCEICGAPGNRLFVDHDHACCGPKEWCSNCVRGMLCPKCNTRMAAIDDDAWLNRGVKYKKTYPVDPGSRSHPRSAPLLPDTKYRRAKGVAWDTSFEIAEEMARLEMQKSTESFGITGLN